MVADDDSGALLDWDENLHGMSNDERRAYAAGTPASRRLLRHLLFLLHWLKLPDDEDGEAPAVLQHHHLLLLDLVAAGGEGDDDGGDGVHVLLPASHGDGHEARLKEGKPPSRTRSLCLSHSLCQVLVVVFFFFSLSSFFLVAGIFFLKLLTPISSNLSLTML